MVDEAALLAPSHVQARAAFPPRDLVQKLWHLEVADPFEDGATIISPLQAAGLANDRDLLDRHLGQVRSTSHIMRPYHMTLPAMRSWSRLCAGISSSRPATLLSLERMIAPVCSKKSRFTTSAPA